jgi:hypothetical protein
MAADVVTRFLDEHQDGAIRLARIPGDSNAMCALVELRCDHCETLVSFRMLVSAFADVRTQINFCGTATYCLGAH